jgi:CRISPR-associated protein Cas8b/Csh1 subtype I-B
MGHMRLLTSAEGIFPKHLRRILNEKRELDKKYPYYKLSEFSPSLSKIRFGFPLIADFWLRGREVGKQKELAELISAIYLSSEINSTYIFSTLANRIRDEFRGPGVTFDIKKLQTLTELSFKALMIIEFLRRIGVIQMNNDTSTADVKSFTKDDLVLELLKFLDEHQKIITSGDLRAVCCAGVLAGITLEEQEENIGSTSFWSRLNRLELNLEKIISLVPQTVAKLRHYGVSDKYRNLIAHILAMEISQLDKNQKGPPEDLINLIFSIGLGEGYLLTQMAKNTGGTK